MDQTRHAKLEMPVEGLNVSTWNKILSEAKIRKVALLIRSWPASTEKPVGSDVLEKFVQNFPQYVKVLEYDYSKDRLPGEVDVSPTKSLDPSTRRNRGPGPISLDDSDSDSDSGESGSDVLNQEFTPGVTYDTGDGDRTSMLTPEDTYTEEDRISMLGALRTDLKFHERGFKRQYSYGAYGSNDPLTFLMDMMDVRHCITPFVNMDVRHCITSLTRNTFALPEVSSGIMWVAVHSGNDICVATLRDHVDRKRVHGFLANFSSKKVLSIFRKCVLSELEDLADPSSKLCEKLQRSIDDVPFCVVSASTPVDPQTFDESGHETSSSAIHVPEAVAFVQGSGLLEQAMDSDSAIKLAISAFERLMGNEFEAKEIEVTVVSGLRNGRVMIWESFYEIRQYAQE